MPKPTETKNQRFQRLMFRRLGRALEELRLVSQLSSENYENTPEEAEEVVMHLDAAVQRIAKSFAVPYSTVIGTKSQATYPGHIDELDTLRALELIKADRPVEAYEVLHKALTGHPH